MLGSAYCWMSGYLFYKLTLDLFFLAKRFVSCIIPTVIAGFPLCLKQFCSEKEITLYF